MAVADPLAPGSLARVTPLKQLADRFGIAILVVHHTRKEKTDDPFDRVSGSQGIAGTVDTLLVLTRDSRMDGAGRWQAHTSWVLCGRAVTRVPVMVLHEAAVQRSKKPEL